jgi:hypothetical protein
MLDLRFLLWYQNYDLGFDTLLFGYMVEENAASIFMVEEREFCLLYCNIYYCLEQLFS